MATVTLCDEQSPLLFSDFEVDDNKTPSPFHQQAYISKKPNIDEDTVILKNTNNEQTLAIARDKETLKNIEKTLDGISSLPNLRPVQNNIADMLDTYRNNFEKYKFFNNVEQQDTDQTKVNVLLLIPAQPTDMDIANEMIWPKALYKTTFGINYNRSVYSEHIENSVLKIIKTFVGNETSTSFSCNSKNTPSKKKTQMLLKHLTKSPGNRLSHLAKRQSIFSSANLLSCSKSTVNSSKLGSRQLLIDTKKIDKRLKIRTPKRRHASAKKKTPTSTDRRKLLIGRNSSMTNLIGGPPTRETSKRALFQSPTNDSKRGTTTSTASIQIKPEIAQRAERSKRVLLFSPKKDRLNNSFNEQSNQNQQQQQQQYDHQQQHQHDKQFNNILSRFNSTSCLQDKSIYNQECLFQMPNLKRKRDDNDFENITNDTDNYSTSTSVTSTVSDTFSRSKSVYIDRFKSANNIENALLQQKLYRFNSEGTFNSSSALSTVSSASVNKGSSTHFKQKLLWAVSKSLQTKQINSRHAQFKQYAFELTKIVNKLFLEISPKSVGSTSETLLRIANRVVFWVIQGKLVDEIYALEKLRNSSKNLRKLTGYVTHEEYEHHKNVHRNLYYSENTLDSVVNCTQKSIEKVLQPNIININNIENNIADAIVDAVDVVTGVAGGAAAAINKDLQNSMTKNNNIMIPTSDNNNNTSSILRENVDTEQRQKSTQKLLIGFSGKDQKNISPYNNGDKLLRPSSTTKITNSNNKTNRIFVESNYANILKAKRQIIFDI